MKKIELLAPAKNLESGKIAILCGADAVYIGPNKFGARARVGNSVEDIAELIKFADQYYAKVYATINTVLFDDEIDEAVKLIHTLYEIGISGIIIQDMGLLEYDLPPVPFIASTQCFVNTPEKVKFFQELGFKRVILPRELSLQQIEKIRTYAPEIELEYFVHGALCVCYSGQCYMSYALGGRSGNRGVCAQPCRKIYSVYDSSGKLVAKNKHLLSLKDQNQSGHLKELLDAGITSFKIEGRLKDENYIKNIVSFYRLKIDNILSNKDLAKSSSGKSTIDYTPDPHKTFNRGYSDYFFTGEQKDIASIDTPKMQGEFLGKVIRTEKTFFQLNNNHDLTNGDGISFFHHDTLMGTRVNTVEGRKIYPDSMIHIKKGVEIYRNFDHQFHKSLSNAKIQRKIDIDIKIQQSDNNYLLIATDENGNCQELNIGNFEEAQNLEKSIELIKSSLAKTGNTIFHCKNIIVDIKNVPFLRKSEINHFRRELLEGLLKERLTNKPKYEMVIKGSELPYVINTLDYTGNVTNKKAEDFYKKHGVKTLTPGAEVSNDLFGKTLMTTKYCIRKELGQCLLETKSQGNPQWKMIDEEGNEFLLKFRCKVCEMEVIRGQ